MDPFAAHFPYRLINRYGKYRARTAGVNLAPSAGRRSAPSALLRLAACVLIEAHDEW
jgi:hypothetical protein